MSRKQELAREQSLTDLEQALGEREQLTGDRDQSRIDQEQVAQDDLRESSTIGDEPEGRVLADRQARIDRRQATRNVSQEALDHSQEGRDIQQQALDETRAMLELPTADQPRPDDARTIALEAIDRAHAARARAEAALIRAQAALARAQAAEVRANTIHAEKN
jgi:hypothetical protein